MGWRPCQDHDRKEGSGLQEVRSAYSFDLCKSLIANIGSHSAYSAAVMGRQSFEELIPEGDETDYLTTLHKFPGCLLPFAAAAIGDQELFRATVGPGFDFHKNAYPFRSVLSAAAATGHPGMVEDLLEDVVDQVGSDSVTHWPWLGHYRSANTFRQAIGIAISTSHPDVVEKIYEFILRLQHPNIDRDMVCFRNDILTDCMEHGDLRVADCVMSFGYDGEVRLDLAELLFARGDKNVLCHLIEKGHIDPNQSVKGKHQHEYVTPLGSP
jgi:hypothetical protein